MPTLPTTLMTAIVNFALLFSKVVFHQALICGVQISQVKVRGCVSTVRSILRACLGIQKMRRRRSQKVARGETSGR
jgi:hypothetical protein